MVEFSALKDLADATLEQNLKRLLNDGARLEARIVMHLAELDARKVHLRAGHQSLFQYCLQGLGLSEFEAVFRITAARVGQKFPVVFEMLEQRRIHLSAVHLLRHHLTDQNHRELFEEACGKSKRQLEVLLAHRFPRTDVPVSLRELQRLEPLSPGRYRLELTIDEETKRDLERASELLSHVSPAHDLSVVVKRGVRAVVAQLEAQRFGKRGAQMPIADALRASGAEKSLSAASNHGPRKRRRRIPSRLRRAVAERDDGCCTFVAPDGRRCCSRHLLQIHHEKPWARGGADTLENLRLLCAEHNQLLAEKEFGTEHITRAKAG